MRYNRSLPVWGAWIEIVYEITNYAKFNRSLPVWGAWIEICISSQLVGNTYSSLPVWGAWIEIAWNGGYRRMTASRSLYGERGLKSR